MLARAKGFIRRHILWLGIVAVLIPLGIMLHMQYTHMVQLEDAPVLLKAHLQENLQFTAQQLQKFYQNLADSALRVSSDDTYEAWVNRAAKHFEKNQCDSVKRLFVAYLTKDYHYEVKFYNPGSCSMESDKGSHEWYAAHAASIPWILQAKKGTHLETVQTFVDERDPENRIVLRPVTTREGKLRGVAGLIVNNDYFKRYHLPTAGKKVLPRFLSQFTHKDLIVSVLDNNHKVIWSSEPPKQAGFEVWVNLPFIFTDWYLGVQRRDMTTQERAEQHFATNLWLFGLMTVFLLGGIVMTLHNASRATKLSQMKTDFVSNVSHELRTPLASIRVFGEFLRLGRVKDPEKIREYGQYIDIESRRLTQLINNILDFSKIESAQRNYQFEEADIAELVKVTLNVFSVRLNQDGFSVDLKVPERGLPPVRMDADAIAQAILNLLDNAMKYSGSSRQIDVRVGHREGFVSISVSDDGIGIPRSEQTKIFEKFYRVSSGLVHDIKGSGLGLSLVKHIAEAHHGRVVVESEPGKGSIFTILLPVGEALPVTASAPRDTAIAGTH